MAKLLITFKLTIISIGVSQKNATAFIYNTFMIETLYKTRTPEKGKSECYVLVFTTRAASGGRAYAFMEEHGQWNDDLQRIHFKVKSISAEEQLTYERARAMYESAKSDLAGKGFIHSFAPGDVSNNAHSEQLPQRQLASA